VAASVSVCVFGRAWKFPEVGEGSVEFDVERRRVEAGKIQGSMVREPLRRHFAYSRWRAVEFPRRDISLKMLR